MLVPNMMLSQNTHVRNVRQSALVLRDCARYLWLVANDGLSGFEKSNRQPSKMSGESTRFGSLLRKSYCPGFGRAFSFFSFSLASRAISGTKSSDGGGGGGGGGAWAATPCQC
jgi:hypothetical protein